MDTRVMNRLPDIDEERLDLFGSPSQAMCKRRHNGAEEIQHDCLVIYPHHLEARISGPRADGHLKHLVINVDEAGTSDHTLVLLLAVQVEAELEEGLAQQSHELV